MTTNLLVAEATIFSRSSAPPPPLIRRSCGSTSSAPSMVTSIVLNFIQRGQRNPQAGGQFLGMNRSGYAANLQSGLNPFAEKTNRVSRGRARSQADDIAIAHEAQAGARRRFFFLVICHADRYFTTFCAQAQWAQIRNHKGHVAHQES